MKRIIGIFLLNLILLFSVDNASSDLTTKSKTYNTSSMINVEETIKTAEVEEVKEETTEDTNDYSYSYSDSNSYISGDSISVGGYNSILMKDYNGDNFYLNHDVYGNYDGRGVPYIDFRTNFHTRKTLIYGHSSLDGNGTLQILQNYHNNKSFFDNNRYITVNYEGNTYTYEIFSVYVSTADNDYSDGLEYFYGMNYSDDEWQQTLNNYKSRSEYDTGVSVSASDKILILQTCSMDSNYYERYYRYNLLVMGKLI